MISEKDSSELQQQKIDYGNRLNWIIDQINRVSNTLTKEDQQLVMSQQNQMENILHQEHDRLLEKKRSIDLATESQKRLITLNENYNKRMMEYIKMMMVIAISLASIGITVALHLHSIIIILVSIVTLSFACIFCFTSYLRMFSRDNIYYDEIKLDNVPDNIIQPKTIVSTTTSSGNTLNSSSFLKCYGSDCCANGTSWDSSTELCIPSKKTSEPMTSYHESSDKHCGGCHKNKNNKYNKKINDQSVPYEPSEFDLYAKI